jgi:hypothetical protein
MAQQYTLDQPEACYPNSKLVLTQKYERHLQTVYAGKLAVSLLARESLSMGGM